MQRRPADDFHRFHHERSMANRPNIVSGDPAAVSERADCSTGHLPVAILGVPIDPLTVESAIGRLEQLVDGRAPAYAVTPNVDFLVQARRDTELREILLEADLVLCDGQPLVWASRWLGNPLPERVAGADLVPRFVARAAQRGYRLFLLGAGPEANDAAAARLRAQHPALVIAGNYAPPFRPLAEMDNGDIARRIRAAQPDVVLVSFGCPKQEKWIARNYRALRVPVCLGVGATIDFLAGRMRRAPRWMRRTGLEWVFRLAQEPGRLGRRYADDLRCFGGAIFAQWWRLGRKRGEKNPPGAVTITGQGGPWQRARVTGHLDRPAIERHVAVWRRIGGEGRDCRLDLAWVDFVDSTGVALLAALQKQFHRGGRRLALCRPSNAVRRAFGQLGLLGYFELLPGKAESGPA
ncbi:MAG: WecB/TagA/CpsF family glycosyltransferase [Opitutae bacterium]|nr:WecB/TagA/CpsF family glycosyltransferase [Opitutae bacterium]